MNRSFLLWSLVVLVFVFACNMPTGLPQAPADLAPTQGLQTLTALASEAETATATLPVPAGPAATSTQAPTEAPPPTATNTPIPCNQASFVSDVTVPDGTKIGLQNDFIKTWKLKNVGSCTWTSEYSMVFDSGDQMGAPASG